MPSFGAAVSQDYFAIFSGNVGSIGILGKEKSAQICRFYTLAKSVIEDMIKDTSDYYSTLAEQLEGMQETLSLALETIELGEEIVGQNHS